MTAADHVPELDASREPGLDACLSITTAAREAGDRPAVITARRTWTFGELAARAVSLPARPDGDREGPPPDPVSTPYEQVRPARTVYVPVSNGGIDLHAEAGDPLHAIPARPAIDTIIAIHRALETRTPLALLHPRATPAELERQRALVRAARLPADTAFVLFTSGSTSRPRGVVLSRAAIVAAAEASAARLGWRDDDRWLLCLPMAHAGGLSIVVRCLIARRPIVLLDDDFDPARVRALARDHGATLASFVPAQLEAVADHAPDAALRAVLLGGAAAAPALVARAIARGWPVRPTYGLTETFGQIATATEPGGPLVPMPAVTITCGETVRVRGPMLATAYLDGAPIAPELVTADLGELRAGTLHLLGRRDDVIVTGGEKVHPLEIEAVLAATPGVRAACVFGVPDDRWGHVVGAAIATDRTFARDAALAGWHTALPAHARPRRLAELADLPQLPSGKLDRRAIASLPTIAVDYDRAR